MNLFDVLVLFVLASAAAGGWQLGFVARAASWIGMAIGVIITARMLPTLIERFDGPDPTGRLFVAIGLLLGGAFLGQAVGLVIGSHLQLVVPPGGKLLDRSAGAVAGALGVLVAVWLLLPAMADVPGTMARLARNSEIAQAIDRWGPPPPDTLPALRRLVGDSQFPEVFAALRPSPDVGPPPAESGLSEDVADRVAASTVRIEGEACGRIQEGSGWVAEPDVVVTNAHVVAGEEEPEVIRQDGERLSATVVVFDPDRDLAVLEVEDVGVPPLPAGDVEAGGIGAVFGHPGGGPLRVAPFQMSEEITAVGRDLYDSHNTSRQVLVLAADLAPGDSGAPLADPSGSVVGAAFAIAPDRSGIAYALTREEVDAALAAPRAPSDTGPCLG